MVSFRTTLLALAAAVAVSADYYIPPDTVPISTRKAWCTQQRSMCKPICLDAGSQGEPETNTCDADTLTYGCVCSDGTQPNVTEYTLTLPYYVCTEWGQQCIKACNGNNQCQGDCTQKHPCGAQTPKSNKTTTTTTTSSATSSATAAPTDQTYDGFGDSSSDSSKSGDGKSAAGALRLGDSYGLAVLAGGLFAGFAMLL